VYGHKLELFLHDQHCGFIGLCWNVQSHLFREFGFSPPWPPARSLRLGECDSTDFYW
jgi:hypothetical protein